MRNWAFQVTQINDYHTTNSHYLTYALLFKRLGECTFSDNSPEAPHLTPTSDLRVFLEKLLDCGHVAHPGRDVHGPLAVLLYTGQGEE